MMNGNNRTPLHLACWTGNVEVIQALLRAKYGDLVQLLLMLFPHLLYLFSQGKCGCHSSGYVHPTALLRTEWQRRRLPVVAAAQSQDPRQTSQEPPNESTYRRGKRKYRGNDHISISLHIHTHMYVCMFPPVDNNHNTTINKYSME